MSHLAGKHAFTPGLLRLYLSALLFAIAWPPSATAQSMCVSGPLSSIANTTCDIGSLQYSFGSASGTVSIEPWGGSTVDITHWSDSDFTFAPVSNGFGLSFLGGPQSITAATSAGMFDYAFLPFTVAVLDPTQQLTSMGISGGTLSASGSYASSASYDMGCLNVSGSVYNDVSDVEGSFSSSSSPTYVFPTDSYGITSLQSVQCQATPFFLYAANGSTAGWDGTDTTFTFNSAPTPPTPEPGSLVLFGTGLVALLGAARRKWQR